jgi:dihydrofolate reductase
MKISIIAAFGRQRELGKDNQLLWHLPADLRHFKQTTLGKPLIMGKTTFESLGGKPLPQRTNIVLTRDKDYKNPDVVVAHAIDEALSCAGGVDEVMICGGARIYEQYLPRATDMYLTYVDGTFEADTWFPDFDISQWDTVETHQHYADENNHFDFKVVHLVRKI